MSPLRHLSPLLLFLLFSFNLKAGIPAAYPPDVIKVLEKAGRNRHQLEAVLSHYSSPKDSLKLQAAYYLIANMEGHSFIISSLYDTNETKIEFDILDYPDFPSLMQGFKELDDKYGELDFQKEFE